MNPARTLSIALVLLALSPRVSEAAPPGAEASTPSDTDRNEARRLFAQGVELARAGNFAESLHAFEAAYALAPHHAVLFNIARAHEELGHAQQALATYERYLKAAEEGISAERRADVAKRMSSLRKQAEARVNRGLPRPEPKLVPVLVDCPYPGFRVLHAGKPVASSPLRGEVFVPEGATELTFSRHGYATQTEALDLETEKTPPLRCTPTLGRLETEQSANITIQSNSGASLHINGEALTSPLRLPPGDHLVEVSAPGHAPERRIVRVIAGKDAAYVIPLETEGPPSEKSPLAGSAARDQPPGGPWSTARVALFGTGVAVAVLGSAYGIKNHIDYGTFREETDRLHDRVEKEHGKNGCSTAASLQLCTDLRTNADNMTTSKTGMAVGYIAGGVGLLGAAATYFLWPKGDAPVTAQLRTEPTYAGVLVQGTL